MADNSMYITGVAEGAFSNALGNLPPWATEKTAVAIEKHLRKLNVQTKLLSDAVKNCMGAGSGALSPEETEKLNNELSKLISNFKKQNDEASKVKKRRQEEDKDNRLSLLMNRKLGVSADKLSYVLAGIATIGTKVLSTEKEYLNVYDSLYKSGINVMNGNNSTADGFKALNQLVGITGLRLQTLQQVAEKYASAVNATGMLKFSKTIAMSNAKMVELGYSSAESAELIGSMIEAQTGLSDLRNRSAEEISADSIKLAAQFGRLSQTVGLSRQQLLDNMKNTAKSADSTLIAAKWGEKAADNFAKAAAGVKDANMRKALEQMAASSNPVFTQAFQQFNSAGMGPFAAQLGRLAQDMRTIDPSEVQDRLESLMKAMPPGRIAQLSARIDQGDPDARAALEMITALRQQVAGISQANEGQIDASTKTASSIAGLQTETEKLSASMQAAFYPMVEQVNMVTSSLKSLNSAISSATNSVSAETRSWIGAGAIVISFVSGLVLAKKALGMVTNIFGKGAGMLGKGTSGSIARALTGYATTAMSSVITVFKTQAANMIRSIGGYLWSAVVGLVNVLRGALSGPMIKTLSGYIWNSIVGVMGVLKSAAGSMITKFISGVGGYISTIFSSVGGFISKIMPALSSIGGIVFKILGVIGWLYTAFEAGYALGTVIYKLISNFEWVTTAFDKLFIAIDKLISYIPGSIGAGAKERLSIREKAEESLKSNVSAKGATEISIPKAPAASTINSPSAVPANSEAVSTDTAPAATERQIPSGTGIEKPSSKSDINNILVYQSSLLEQILSANKDSVSVGKDIVRYMRNQ